MQTVRLLANSGGHRRDWRVRADRAPGPFASWKHQLGGNGTSLNRFGDATLSERRASRPRSKIINDEHTI